MGEVTEYLDAGAASTGDAVYGARCSRLRKPTRRLTTLVDGAIYQLEYQPDDGRWRAR